MNTQEKLEAIKAKCHELLALAEKRTQGKWQTNKSRWDGTWNVSGNDTVCDMAYLREDDHARIEYDKDEPNAAYIAACAGSAEAGWRATKEECEDLLPILRSSENMNEVDALTSYARGRAISLCVAWQEEQL